MIFLQSHQVTTTLAVRIYKMYGDTSIRQVQANPYKLAQDIYGIGFKTADQIALHLGLAFDSAERVAAGVIHSLNEFSEEGHTYVPRAELAAKVAVLLEVAQTACEQAIETLREAEQV